MIRRKRYNIKKEMLIKKCTLFKAMRSFLEDKGFIEIHTPILHHRPDYPVNSHFTIIENRTVTYLRTCMELRLRQVLSIGLKSVYEIGPCFRKEKKIGSPFEFYIMECFKESIDFDELISLTEDICKYCAKSININLLDGKWPRRSIYQLFPMNEIQEMREKSSDVPSFIELFDKTLDSKIRNEINESVFFLIDYPVETVCLARRKEHNSNLIERFELFINNIEVAHGFIDSIDSQDVQLRMKEIGWNDKPLWELLKKKKLPTSGGVGIGMERLFKALCGIENIYYEVIVPEILEYENSEEEQP